MIPPIKISRFRRRSDNEPKQSTVEWTVLKDMLREHRQREDKDGALWAPTTYAPEATRANANVLMVTCFVVDVDDGTPLDEAMMDSWGGLAWIAHSSYSSTDLHPKWRVVFPLASPVAAADWPAVHRKLVAALVGGHSDPSCKDVSRMYFTPASPAATIGQAFAYDGAGMALDHTIYPDAVDAVPEFRSEPVGSGAGTGRPGGDYNAQATSENVLGLLVGMGWAEGHRRGDVIEVTRPGKSSGISGTIGFVGDGGSNIFFCFTSNGAPFAAGASYAPFAVYAHAFCGGDFEEAARRLGREGYGEHVPPTVAMSIDKYFPKELQVAPVVDDDDPFADVPAPKSPRNRRPRQTPEQLTDECSWLHTTDLGNAERLVKRHGENVRYSAALGWLTFDGMRWVQDESGAIMRATKHATRAIMEESIHVGQAALREPDEEKRGKMTERSKALMAWAIKSESNRSLLSTVALAQSEPGVFVGVGELDADRYLLNCANGTLDLRTGCLRDHDRADLCTKILETAYAPGAKCPIWEAFLARVLPDEEIRGYIQRAAGYALTGDVGEQVMFFLYGTGANGKSTLLETLLNLVGGYGRQASSELLTAKRADMVRDDIANLIGRRMVVTIETEEGKAMAESLMKQLTGGDRITARLLYHNSFEFEPTHKIFLAGNHRPAIRNNDYGVWRRMRLIEFGETIPDAEKDTHLPQKLQAEYAGILAWAVRGCLEWQKHGMQTPESVMAIVQEYRAESDLIGQFVEDACVCNPNAQVKAGILFDNYVKWCERRHEKSKTNTAFGRAITEREGIERREMSSGRMYWGIGIKTDTDTPYNSEGEF